MGLIVCLIDLSIVIASCENGTKAFDGAQIASVTRCPTKLYTNGAGDMFADAFLYAINDVCSYVWTAKFANVAQE